MSMETYLRRKLQDVCLDPTEDVRLDHLVQLLHKTFVQVHEARLQIFEVSTPHQLVDKMEEIRPRLKVSRSRKFRRLKSSRRLLFRGVPVRRMRWME